MQLSLENLHPVVTVLGNKHLARRGHGNPSWDGELARIRPCRTEGAHKRAIREKDLNAVIAAIGHQHFPSGYGHIIWIRELARTRPLRAKGAHNGAVRAKHLNAVIAGIGYKYFATR